MSRRNAGEPLPLRGADDRRVIGLEHEYRVLEDAQPIDFRSVIHRLDADGLRLDPTDPNAYRCAWGGLLTADGPEAEVAIAPVPVAAGCSFELERRATVGLDVLGTLLPEALALEGYSTHLSIELDDEVVARAGRLFASRYAAPMMLLLDKPASPGLLVRPRPARLEICGEHAAGAQLRAAATFATAGALACGAAARSRRARRLLPTPVRASIQASAIRSGWYIDRTAFGSDLYRHGRATVLHDRRGQRRTANAQLVEAWERSRAIAETCFAATELDLVDRIIDRQAPLPLEDPRFDETPPGLHVGSTQTSPFEHVTRERTRPGFRIAPRSIAWNAVVFDIHGARSAVACIPRRALDEFVLDLDAGRLDQTINDFLATPPADRVLMSSEQADEPRLYDAITSPDAIVPAERGPGGLARLGGNGGGSPAEDRRNKGRRRPPRRGVALAAVVVVAVVVIAAGAAFATRSKSDDTTTVAAAPPPTDLTVATPPASSSASSDDSPLTVDPCSLLTDGDVGAYGGSISGSYLPQQPFTSSPTGGGSQPSDPAKQRYCTWRFEAVTADAHASADGEVVVEVDKVSKRSLPTACHLVSSSGPGHVVDNAGDHAEVTETLACVVVGDVRVEVSYGGVSENSVDIGVAAHILQVIASEIGNSPPPPTTAPIDDAPPVTDIPPVPDGLPPAEAPPSAGGGGGPTAHPTAPGTG